MAGGHHHRSGGLKQQNKKNKRSKSSKRSVNRKQGGKVAGAGRAGVKSQGASNAKADRIHAARQRRDAKRKEAVDARRNLGRLGSTGGDATALAGLGSPVPRIVGIISISEDEENLEENVRKFITSGADVKHEGVGSSITAKFLSHKRDGFVTLLTSSGCFRPQYANYGADNTDEGRKEDASISAALDLCRVCDLVIFAVDGTVHGNSSANNDGDETVLTGMSIGGSGSSTVATGNTNNKADLDDLISERGDRILSAVKAQGLPTPLTLLVNRESSEEEEEEELMSLATTLKTARRHALRRRYELKRYVNRLAVAEFGEGARVGEIDLAELNGSHDMEVDGDSAVAQVSLIRSKKILPVSLASSTNAAAAPTRSALIRTLCTSSASAPKWVSNVPRPYLVADGGVEYDANDKTLRLTGYLRGTAPLDANGLIHVPNAGTFAIKSVGSAVNRAPFRRTKTSTGSDSNVELLVHSDPMKREALDMFASPDALDGEQNLVGFDEENEDNFDSDDEAEGTMAADGTFKAASDARPAGWSDYQSAWLDAVDDEGGERDYGELAFSLNKKDAASVSGGLDIDMDEANDVTAEERALLLGNRRKNQQEDLEFPDEVEIGEDDKASERFQRYRSLKSFRKSYWDPKENLPESYGTIYHFSSFRATQNDVVADAKDVIKVANEVGRSWWGGAPTSNGSADMEDEANEDLELLEGCVSSGAYVTITVEGVNSSAFSLLSSHSVICAVGLLPHENKVSVMHIACSQTTKCEQPEDTPIKSKDILTFRCGWRTWQSRPVFSQNNINSDKHKFERYLPTGGTFFAATVFGPATYSPCPVLVFREPTGVTGGNRRQLVAVGSTLGADADRIVVKRITLTGYPVRVHKRHATVKYMFYNPDDVKWFKPAGLLTKHGLQGNIVESVGEHGTMKCLFNAPIKQHDTVCLPLYKRVFPKYAQSSVQSDDGTTSMKDIVVL